MVVLNFDFHSQIQSQIQEEYDTEKEVENKRKIKIKLNSFRYFSLGNFKNSEISVAFLHMVFSFDFHPQLAQLVDRDSGMY